MKVKIDIESEIKIYTAELNGLLVQLRQVEEQRNTLIQAITERRGIIAYLGILSKDKE